MVSVVIPAFNEERELGASLASLAVQKTRERFEVIVVDNNSTDRTDRVAREFFGVLDIRVIHEPRQGRGQARHTGFRAARGEVILSTDADVVVPPDWIEAMARELRLGGFVAVAGSARLKDGPRLARCLFRILQPLSARVYRRLFGHYWLPGFNFAIYQDAYIRAGEFDVMMDALEDNDLSWRVRRVGRIKFIPTMPVAISGRRFRLGFWRGMLEYAAVFIRYYFFKDRRIRWSNIR